MLNFCDFIQVFVFTTNHHLKVHKSYDRYKAKLILLSILLNFIYSPNFEKVEGDILVWV